MFALGLDVVTALPGGCNTFGARWRAQALWRGYTNDAEVV
jgi:hypothetical protein